MSEHVFSVSQDGGVAQIRFTRPQAANAMGSVFWREFPRAVEALDRRGTVRVLVISGEGKHFCSGMDVSAFADSAFRPEDGPAEREAFAAHVPYFQAAMSSLPAARFPVIAAIQGACLGAGLDLAAACDLRFCAPDAYFRIEEINIGMMADVGSLQRLPRSLPDAVLRQMAFCGTTLRADRALALGFANDITPDPLATALEAAAEIARRAPLAITGSKRAIDFAQDHSVAESLDQAAMLQAMIWSTSDILGAITARGQKTEPAFMALRGRPS